MSRAAVPECLHRGRLRQFSAQYGGWVAIKLVLLSHALVVDPDADAPSAVSVTPRRRRNSLKVWMDLCLVANVASVSKVDEPRALSLPPAARRVSHGNATPGRHVFVVTTENPAQVFRFAAESDEEREEWVRCLLLARKLQAAAAEAATASLTSPQSQPDTTAAFLRFASSGSEDSDSDAEPASPRDSDAASSPQQHSIRSARPISTSPRSPIVKPKRSSPVALTILHVVATIDNDASVSATLPLSAASLAEIPVHRIKLDALRQLRVHLRGLDDGTRQQCRKLKQTGVIQQQDLERREPDWFALLLEDQALWLQDEKRPIGFYLAGVAKKKVTLVLRPANQTPLPVPRIVISGMKNKVSDLSQRTYTVYLVDVTFNDMTWQLARRFKEFATLHEQLEIKHPGVELPRLPSKHVFTPLEGDFVERRRLHLEKFLHSLLQDPVISNDVVFLSFLGVVSTSRDPELSQSITSVLHVTSLHNSLEYGDILLFSCKFGASILQRTFTGSKYDHVGMVVPGESRNLPRILEATSDGIQVYSLKLRLMAYSREVSNAIMVRRFNVERSPAVVEELKRFVSRVDGNPYSILGILRSSGESDRSVQDLVGKDNRNGCDEAVGSAEASLDSTDAGYASSTSSSPSIEVNSPTAATAKTRRKARQEKKRKYFCSSLVASALKHLGWLETTRKSSSFWPGSFENGGEVESLLAPGVTLGPETRIDCRIVEVGLATPDDKAQQ